MNVWSFDAAEFSDADDLSSRPIYRTTAITEFLRFDKSQTRIISGLKGTGKTLFLKLLSIRYRRQGSFSVIPATELTERLYSIDYDFSSDRAKAWASHERWQYIWRAVLSVVILKSIKRPLPPKVLEVFPENLGISIASHLSVALNSRTIEAPAFKEAFPKYLDALIQNINQPVALFVDNIDEALARHAGFNLYYDSVQHQSQSGTHSYQLWLAAQIGFILAVRELTYRNAHLKLYGTVRAEAVRDNPTSTAFNIQAMVLDLNYSAEELRGIFETKLAKLRESSPQYFARLEAPNPIPAFFQSDTIDHISVTRADGRPYEERIFDYLRRHSRGRPRELDFIGYELQMIPPQNRTPEKIRGKIAELSARFYKFAKNEAVPFWDPKLDLLLDQVPSNIISRKDAEKTADRICGKETGSVLWEKLYANGLCGAVVNAYPRGRVQRFSNHDGAAELSLSEFKNARLWVLHPCVNIAKRSSRVKYRPNKNNVAGHLYGYEAEPKPGKKHIHVLIGAGKLGLGLVVPALLRDQRTNIVIIARKSEKWERLFLKEEAKCLQIKYFRGPGKPPREEKINLQILTDEKPGWQEDIRKKIRRNRCTLLLSADDAALKYVLGLGDSIGISVGSKNIEGIAAKIAEIGGKSRTVIGYENDDEKLKQAGRILNRKDMRLIPTVVDRICVDRKIEEEAVIIKAEPYGRISAFVENVKTVTMPPAFLKEAKPDASGLDADVVVRTIPSETEFNLLVEKKKRLVNSVHTAAALFVHKALRDAGAKLDTADDYLLGLIAGNMDIYSLLEQVKRIMILAVLAKYPPSLLEKIDGQGLIRDLNECGDKTIKRILEWPDSPSRVLKNDADSILEKYRRLFRDAKDLAFEAVHNDTIKKMHPMEEGEIASCLLIVNEAFLNLLSYSKQNT